MATLAFGRCATSVALLPQHTTCPLGNERLSIRAEQLMFTEIYIQNYRSIAKATVNLSPFTLLIGANGTG